MEITRLCGVSLLCWLGCIGFLVLLLLCIVYFIIIIHVRGITIVCEESVGSMIGLWDPWSGVLLLDMRGMYDP